MRPARGALVPLAAAAAAAAEEHGSGLPDSTNPTIRQLHKGDDSAVLRHGFLSKQGHFFRNWKRRFFVLTRQALFYYHSDSIPDAPPQGKVLLRDIDHVQTRHASVGRNNAAARGAAGGRDAGGDCTMAAFEVVTHSGKDLLLVAPDSAQGVAWVDAIQAAMVVPSGLSVLLRATGDLERDGAMPPEVCEGVRALLVSGDTASVAVATAKLQEVQDSVVQAKAAEAEEARTAAVEAANKRRAEAAARASVGVTPRGRGGAGTGAGAGAGAGAGQTTSAVGRRSWSSAAPTRATLHTTDPEDPVSIAEALGRVSLADDSTDHASVVLPSAKCVPFDTEYELKEQVGTGAFSKVYRCIHRTTGDVAAVKIIHKPSLNPRQVRALLREVHSLRQLRHPNIMALLDVYDDDAQPVGEATGGASSVAPVAPAPAAPAPAPAAAAPAVTATGDGGTPQEDGGGPTRLPHCAYLVTELLSGGELFDQIISRDRYTEGEAQQVVRSIARALTYMHSKGFVHRDLKPENILLSSTKDDATVKIADLGFSRKLPPCGFLSTSCGSPSYIAPEVLLGSHYDTAVDMWALGVITYILLCGFPPFHHHNEDMLFRKICAGKFQFEPKYWARIGGGVKRLITSLLQISPKLRPCAEDVLRHHWVAGHDSQVQLDTVGQQLRLFMDLNASVIKRGYLTKQGGLVKNWKLRFFVLTAGALMYFEDEDAPHPKGVIPVDAITSVRALLAPQAPSATSQVGVGGTLGAGRARPRSPVAIDMEAIGLSVAGESKPSSPYKPNALEVCTAVRTFVLLAASPQERDEWVSAITPAQQRARVLKQVGSAMKSSQMDEAFGLIEMAAEWQVVLNNSTAYARRRSMGVQLNRSISRSLRRSHSHRRSHSRLTGVDDAAGTGPKPARARSLPGHMAIQPARARSLPGHMAVPEMAAPGIPGGERGEERDSRGLRPRDLPRRDAVVKPDSVGSAIPETGEMARSSRLDIASGARPARSHLPPALHVGGPTSPLRTVSGSVAMSAEAALAHGLDLSDLKAVGSPRVAAAAAAAAALAEAAMVTTPPDPAAIRK